MGLKSQMSVLVGSSGTTSPVRVSGCHASSLMSPCSGFSAMVHGIFGRTQSWRSTAGMMVCFGFRQGIYFGRKLNQFIHPERVMRLRPYFLLAVMKIEEEDQQQVLCLIRVFLSYGKVGNSCVFGRARLCICLPNYSCHVN